MIKLRTVCEPYPSDVLEQLADLKVDHAVAVLMQADRVVGYTMCHTAGPKQAPLKCGCQ